MSKKNLKTRTSAESSNETHLQMQRKEKKNQVKRKAKRRTIKVVYRREIGKSFDISIQDKTKLRDARGEIRQNFPSFHHD